MKWLELKTPPLLLVVIFAFAMWALNSRVSFGHHLLFSRLGLLVLIIATIIALLGVLQFRKANTTVDPRIPEQSTSLVTSGIYQISRNPMYLGFLFMLIGWAMILFNPLALLFIPVFILYMNRFQILPEERFMAENFGQEYLDYLKQVRRWI